MGPGKRKPAGRRKTVTVIDDLGTRRRPAWDTLPRRAQFRGPRMDAPGT